MTYLQVMAEKHSRNARAPRAQSNPQRGSVFANSWTWKWEGTFRSFGGPQVAVAQQTLPTFATSMHFRTINSMSQRCFAPQARAGQLCCARLTQSSAARRINVLRSGPKVRSTRFVCMASRGAPILERSDMQQPLKEESVRY